MRFGFWTPVFGGWLRNVEDEQTPLTWEHLKEIAQTAEAIGYDLTLIPELYLNDIKGPSGPTFDAWATAAALAASTDRLEILTAIRPSFHPVALTAKQIATIQAIAGNRLSLNVVSAWWQEEARQYGIDFEDHDHRYAVTQEYVDVLTGLWRETPFTHHGRFFDFDNTSLEPKPEQRPVIYAGGESEAGRQAIANFADAYLVHGGTPQEVQAKIADLQRRRVEVGRQPFQHFGMAAYVIVRDTEAQAQAELERITRVQAGAAYDSYRDFVSKSQLDTQVSLHDYSVSNRGLRPNLIGTPVQVADRIRAFHEAGVDTLLIQASPVLPELQRIAEQVFPLVDRQG
ncbi:LLM class flavin-dependent oxidoreductase [Pseudoclavibacter sp. CFCC 14310]|uniref:LLM class flavin-dependent oxidoreductase n=1 Tax=Pseudoclavibacter sp. CFCC 14310 TaxID=2615180 RepID=UPI001301575B|nr:LLM class flavin-dependent oxidoreductase [Pseudoclavibacter sp. CFCC 14310]KAB1644479.1 LLM class flavin-dependent oxidoreductase [Pseudoclavibacter sp. CFCC 14310]